MRSRQCKRLYHEYTAITRTGNKPISPHSSQYQTKILQYSSSSYHLSRIVSYLCLLGVLQHFVCFVEHELPHSCPCLAPWVGFLTLTQPVMTRTSYPASFNCRFLSVGCISRIVCFDCRRDVLASGLEGSCRPRCKFGVSTTGGNLGIGVLCNINPFQFS